MDHTTLSCSETKYYGRLNTAARFLEHTGLLFMLLLVLIGLPACSGLGSSRTRAESEYIDAVSRNRDAILSHIRSLDALLPLDPGINDAINPKIMNTADELTQIIAQAKTIQAPASLAEVHRKYLAAVEKLEEPIGTLSDIEYLDAYTVGSAQEQIDSVANEINEALKDVAPPPAKS
jgi:hypothetical protein